MIRDPSRLSANRQVIAYDCVAGPGPRLRLSIYETGCLCSDHAIEADLSAEEARPGRNMFPRRADAGLRPLVRALRPCQPAGVQRRALVAQPEDPVMVLAAALWAPSGRVSLVSR